MIVHIYNVGPSLVSVSFLTQEKHAKFCAKRARNDSAAQLQLQPDSLSHHLAEEEFGNADFGDPRLIRSLVAIA